MTKQTMKKQIKVGIQRSITDPKCKVESVPLLSVLEQMRTSDNLKRLTEKVLAATSKDERDAIKKQLPAVIISADTTHRKVHPDDTRTGLLLMDVDGKDHPDMLMDEMTASVQEMCDKYSYVIGYCLSPSWKGLKVLCGIDPSEDTHLRSFMALEQVFSTHGIIVDRACKDLKRVNFLCHDPMVESTLTAPLEAWGGEVVEPMPVKERKQYKMSKISSGSDLTPDDEAQLCLQHISPDIDYADWVSVGMALKSHGCSCATWDAWSAGAQSYKQGECERKWNGFSGSGVGFGSIVRMATDGNGGRNPIIAENNQRERVNVSTDFDDISDGSDDSDDSDDSDSQPPTVSIDDIHYYKRQYYTLNAAGTEYISFGADDLTRMLRIMGYSAKGADGEVSAVDKIKNMIITEQYVHFVGVIAGRSIGVVENGNGIRHLVTRQNRRVEAAEGEWPTINVIIDSIFGENQRDYFYAWLHRSRKQLERQSYMQGHALVIAGGVGKGKSLIQETIVSRLLGASARASLYLTGGTTFNADLVSSETLTIDDDGGDRDAKSRRVYGDRLKMITAGSKSVQCHGKGVDGYMVEPLWRVCICMNDDDQSLGAFPSIGEGDCDSVGDKILLLKCLGLAPIPFTGNRDQSGLLEAAIKRDLPGFAHFIDTYTIPSNIQKGDCRFGFDEYHHSDLLETVNQDSNERTLLSVTDHLLFDDKDDFSNVAIKLDSSTSRYYWEGSAVDWANVLLSANRMPQYRTVSGILAFGDNAIKAGKAMGAMSKISDGRVVKSRSNKGVKWVIWERSEVSEGVENDPF